MSTSGSGKTHKEGTPELEPHLSPFETLRSASKLIRFATEVCEDTDCPNINRVVALQLIALQFHDNVQIKGLALATEIPVYYNI